MRNLVPNAEHIRHFECLWSEPARIFLAILLVIYFTAFLHFAPALYSADWLHIVWGNWTDTWLDFRFPWPMFKASFFIEDRIFGIDINAFYIILGIAQALQAIILYLIVRLITNDLNLLHGSMFSLVSILLFLVYPTVYTRMWSTMLFFYVPILLSLLYGYTMVKYAISGRHAYFGLSILFLVASLATYEVQLGVVVAWALILFVLYRKAEFTRGLILLFPIILVGIYIIWRTLAFEDEGGKYSFLTDTARKPSVFLDPLIAGYKINLGYGWTTTIEHFLPGLPTTTHAALLLVGGILILWLSFRLWFSIGGRGQFGRGRETEARNWPLDQRWPSIRSFAIAGFAGLILIAAGYFPIVLKYSANLAGSNTRYNFPSTIGSSIALASGLMIGAIIFARTKDQVRYLFSTAAVPFVLLGILAQNLVQINARIAWHEEKLIYNKLFSIAPNFVDHTRIVLVLRGYRDRTGEWDHWRRVPIGTSWAASSAIQLFYDNPTLSGHVLYPDLTGQPESTLSLRGIVDPVPSVEQSNVVRMRLDAFTPYAQSVFLEYDSETESLRPLAQLPARFVEGASQPIRLRTNRILTSGVSDVRWRRLVAE